MTAYDDPDRTTPGFDRLMTAWFDAEALVAEPPDLLDRTLARTRRARPRPAWLLPERWIPMDLTMQRARWPRVAPILALVALLIVVAIAAIAIAGSQRQVPSPFGLAANGDVAVVTADGEIAKVDPVTGLTEVLVGGPEPGRYPTFSLDGTRVAFVRAVDGGDALFVVGASGGSPTRITPDPLGSPGVLAWSPDGSRVAFQADRKLWIARTDGSGVQELDLGVPVVDEIEWRPPDGAELLVRGERDGLAGLFLVHPDGSGLRAITPVDGGAYDYLWVSWAPDGDRVAYHIEATHEVHILTVGAAAPTVLHPTNGMGMMFPRFSPDGKRLAVMAWHPDGSVQIGILAADDPTPDLTLAGPVFHSGIQFDWSPDGTRVLATGWESSEPWILDPSGGPGVRTSWGAAFPDWVEWQRVAP